MELRLPPQGKPIDVGAWRKEVFEYRAREGAKRDRGGPSVHPPRSVKIIFF